MPFGPFSLGILGAALALIGWLAHRRRFGRYTADSRTSLDDDLIRRIERDGRIELDEPIDRDEVRAEEERFWSETWDRPDEW